MEHLRIVFLFALLSLTIRCRGHDSDTEHVHEEIGDLPTAQFNETADDNVLRSALDVVEQENVPEDDGIEARMAVDCPSTVVCGPGQQCTMHLGFPNCFVPNSACSTIPCANGGSCINNICQCPFGYSGHHCKTAPGGCHSGSCQNGGYCVYQANAQSPICQCVGSWTGPNCATSSTRLSSDPCQQNLCQGDCNCQPSCKHENGYVCISAKGFLGRHCTIPVPELLCSAQQITVDISNEFYNEWDLSQANSYIYMAPTSDSPASQLQECRARLVGSSYRITLSHPFTQCGTVPTTSGTTFGGSTGASVLFTNTIWINKNLVGAFDMPFAVIRVQCVYSDLYSVYTSLRPVMQDPVRLTDSMSYEVISTLCKTSTCNAVCPANLVMQPSAVYTVGQILHLGFGIKHIQPVELDATTNAPFVHHVTISCSTAATSQTSLLNLYENGCPTNHGTALNSKLNSNLIGKNLCLSFRLPRMRSCVEMFIEIRFQICHDSTISRVCSDGSIVQTCPTKYGRRRRSIQGAGKPVLIGPIYILEPTEGTDHLTFLADYSDFVIDGTNATRVDQRFPETSFSPASPTETTISRSNNPDLPLLFFVVGLFLLFLAFLVTTVLFLYRKRSSPKMHGLAM